jgi:hypothetical protein
MAELTTDIRETVREKYAEAARAAAAPSGSSSCCGGPGAEVFGAALYGEGDTEARAPAPTCSSAPGAWARAARPSAWT